MKPELTLKKEEIEKFTIDVVNNYEGCKEALLFLKRVYGKEVMDLRTRRQDFVSLSKNGKPQWVIRFLLNSMTKTYRAKFIAGIVSENLNLVESDAVKIEIVNAMSRFQSYSDKPSKDLYDDLAHDFEYLNEKRSQIKRMISAAGAQAVMFQQSKFETLQSESAFLKAILNILEDIDSPLTRSAVVTFQSISESKQWKFSRQKQVDFYTATMEDIASTLIDYTQIFVETN